MSVCSTCTVEERSESFFFSLSFFVPVQGVDAEFRPCFLATALRRSRLNTDSGQMEEIELSGGIFLLLLL